MFVDLLPFLILVLSVLMLAFSVVGAVLGKKKLTWLRVTSTVFLSHLLPFWGFVGSFLIALMGYPLLIAPFVIALLALTVLLVLLIFGVHKKRAILPCVAVIAASALAAGIIIGRKAYTDSIERVKEVSQWEVEDRFSPYTEDNDLVTLDGDQTLDWNTDEPLPNIDGATALYPVYAAIARETYPAEYFVPRDKFIVGDPEADEKDRLDYLKKAGYTAETESEKVRLTTTPNAYMNLIEGYTDIIFVASASDEQQRTAAERGVELVFTPIGREAFVFFVNKENPVESLDVQQIIDIYSGKTTRWSDVGVRGFGRIKAYQRPKNSGSQTALEKLMGDTPLMKAPTEYVATGMGDIIRETAYTNFKNALGYSFRFYATELAPSDGIRLLKINGVEPTKENIENLTYPLASDFYAVTRADASENTKKLLEFVTSEEGQTIVEKAGYSRAGESAW